jgi:hypothetical protein
LKVFFILHFTQIWNHHLHNLALCCPKPGRRVEKSQLALSDGQRVKEELEFRKSSGTSGTFSASHFDGRA